MASVPVALAMGWSYNQTSAVGDTPRSVRSALVPLLPVRLLPFASTRLSMLFCAPRPLVSSVEKVYLKFSVLVVPVLWQVASTVCAVPSLSVRVSFNARSPDTVTAWSKTTVKLISSPGRKKPLEVFRLTERT